MCCNSMNPRIKNRKTEKKMTNFDLPRLILGQFNVNRELILSISSFIDVRSNSSVYSVLITTVSSAYNKTVLFWRLLVISLTL